MAAMFYYYLTIQTIQNVWKVAGWGRAIPVNKKVKFAKNGLLSVGIRETRKTLRCNKISTFVLS